MRKSLDMTFRFRGLLDRPSHCRLRVWEEAGQPPVVVFTERLDNTGSTITDAIECLAWEAYKLLERPATEIVVVEHYRDRSRIGGKEGYTDELNLVTFTQTSAGYTHPHWRSLSAKELEAMTGEPLTD